MPIRPSNLVWPSSRSHAAMGVSRFAEICTARQDNVARQGSCYFAVDCNLGWCLPADLFPSLRSRTLVPDIVILIQLEKNVERSNRSLDPNSFANVCSMSVYQGVRCVTVCVLLSEHILLMERRHCERCEGRMFCSGLFGCAAVIVGTRTNVFDDTVDWTFVSRRKHDTSILLHSTCSWHAGPEADSPPFLKVLSEKNDNMNAG